MLFFAQRHLLAFELLLLPRFDTAAFVLRSAGVGVKVLVVHYKIVILWDVPC